MNLRTLFTYFGNFISYFDRIFTLDSGARVWTDFGEWFWGWQKWLKLLGETILISYVGTLIGAVIAFALNFFAAAKYLAERRGCASSIRRLLEFARTVPGIVFALIFVIAFGLGPMAGVLAIAIHSTGALGKLFSEIVENADMKPVEGVRSTGASWLSCMRFAVMPQVAAGYASYALLRFEINVREASVMGFVGAGGIGQELVVAIRKFYYSDVSAILRHHHRHGVRDRHHHRLVARPAVRQGRARMSQLPKPDREQLRAKYPEVFERPAVGAARDARDDRRLRLAIFVFGLVDLDFSPARLLSGLQPARLDHLDDDPARSRLVAAALSEGARRDAVDRAARHHHRRRAGAAGQPAGGAQHRSFAVCCASRCGASSIRSAASIR